MKSLILSKMKYLIFNLITNYLYVSIVFGYFFINLSWYMFIFEIDKKKNENY